MTVKEDRSEPVGGSGGIDLDAVEAALHKAALHARRIAMITTGTIVVYKDGKVVHEEVPWEDLSKEEWRELFLSHRW